MAKRIYLDYASLTPIDPRVLREMKAFTSPRYANPSSLYREGVAAKKAMEEGRKSAADFINAHSDEIIFTSGGTEANGLALEGAGRAAHRSGIEKPHLIISNIEHSSIIEVANMMERHGVEVTRLAVNDSGVVSPDELKKAIKPNTFMVSIMTVNNEIGTVQPIRDIAKVVRWARTNITKSEYPLLHTDACQAALHYDLNVEQSGVDLMTLDGSKVYGPRGLGMLYVKRGTPIEEMIYGGGQESGRRSGTENLPAIKGFAKALELASAGREKETKRLVQLKQVFVDGLKAIRPDIAFNPRVSVEAAADLGVSPHILNVSIPGIDNEFFVLQLDAKGVAVSTKSSCLRDQDHSYVLQAIAANSRRAVRFSFGRWTRPSGLKKALKIIGNIDFKGVF